MKNKTKNYWPYYFGTLEWFKRIRRKIYFRIYYITHFRECNRMKNIDVSWNYYQQDWEDHYGEGE